MATSPERIQQRPGFEKFLVASAVCSLGLSWSFPCYALELDGFGHAIYQQHFDADDSPAENGAFGFGEITLFATESLASNVEALLEVAIESETHEVEVEVERFEVKYLVSDALRIHAGRFHTPIGFWNLEFHHAAVLQTSIHRPAVAAFEHDRGILPMHSIGLLVDGTLFVDFGALSYAAGMANGSSIDLGRLHPDTLVDPDRDKALSLWVQLEPGLLPEWRIGASAYYDRVIGESATLKPVRNGQLIGNLFVARTMPPFELIATYYALYHYKRTPWGRSWLNHAYYLHLGYEIAEQVTFYGRYEQMIAESDDPYLDSLDVGSLLYVTLGIRVRVGDISTVKLEARRLDDSSGVHWEGALQWAVVF